MNGAKDHYNFDEVTAACAKHAWERRQAELMRRGIESEQHLLKEIVRVVNDPATKAFRAQPQPERDGIQIAVPLAREIYELRPYNEQNPDRGFSVVLNPNRDERGDIYGGTVTIREGSELTRLERQEERDSGEPPLTVEGGRGELRNQQQFVQLVDPQIRALNIERKPYETLLERVEVKPQERQETYAEELRRKAREQGQELRDQAKQLELDQENELEP